MSFICDKCHTPAPRNVSPIVVVIEEPFTHSRLSLKTGIPEVSGVGTRIVKELKHCPTCCGATQAELEKLMAPKGGFPDFSAHKVWADNWAKKHVRTCEGFKTIHKAGQKVMVPCRTCKDIMDHFATIPINVLSPVLSESKAFEVKIGLKLQKES